jgi:hypothetical protein
MSTVTYLQHLEVVISNLKKSLAACVTRDEKKELEADLRFYQREHQSLGGIRVAA